MLSWFNSKEAETFGVQLAEFVKRRLPISSNDKSKKVSASDRKAALIELFKMIQKFSSSQSLNLYQKAKLGNSLKWVLLEAGYDKDFVDDLTKELLIKL